MFYVKLFAIVGGGVLCVIGFQEWRVSRGTSSKPVDVKLADLESGKPASNNYVKIGEHHAVYYETVYSCRQSKYATGEPSPDTSVSYSYHPVISASHPFVKKLGALEQKYGRLDKVPATEKFPTIDSFCVLIKTKKYDKIRDLPTGFKRVQSIQGMIINDIESLDKEEEKLIKQSFPNLDVDKVLILEENREPSSALKSWGMMIGGVLLSLGGIAFAILHHRAAEA